MMETAVVTHSSQLPTLIASQSAIRGVIVFILDCEYVCRGAAQDTSPTE
jgi:hypothetical protein